MDIVAQGDVVATAIPMIVLAIVGALKYEIPFLSGRAYIVRLIAIMIGAGIYLLLGHYGTWQEGAASGVVVGAMALGTYHAGVKKVESTTAKPSTG